MRGWCREERTSFSPCRPIWRQERRLHGSLTGAPSNDSCLAKGRNIAFVIPASHVTKRIHAIIKAEAAAKANPPELAIIIAYIPAARARLNEARLQSNDVRLIEGVSYTLDDLEEIGKARLNDEHLKELACVAGHLDRFCREDAGGIGRLMKLVPLDDFVTKLAGFQNKLQQTSPTELIDKDWTKNLPHLEELNALKEEIAVRLQVLEDEPTSFAPESRQKARNALRALRRELHQNPLHLSVIDNVRRELAALDRSLFAELILASQFCLAAMRASCPTLWCSVYVR